MSIQNLIHLPQWQALDQYASAMNRPENHLKNLLQNAGRLEQFSAKAPGLWYDYSRQRIDKTGLELLLDLARARKIHQGYLTMARGEKVNITENRAALHTAGRSFSDPSLLLDDMDVLSDIRKVKDSIRQFASAVQDGSVAGSTGKGFRDIVVIGIGGSYLGTEFVSTALKAYAHKHVNIHYLSNVDTHNFGHVVAEIDPETTLWVVISKSYTTAETLANTRQAVAFMAHKGLEPAQHMVTVTSKGSPGDDPKNPVLATFHMFDYIGGRYSVTSAVGGLPLSLYLGYDTYERFLKGAEAMDQHTLNTPVENNVPLIAALISVWNNNFLGYPASAIIPYASPLSKLAPHVQQLNMESNGKSVTVDDTPLEVTAGPIIFGEPGTNAQHSFFQLAHQGRPFPIEFIGVLRPQYTQYQSTSNGVTNHQELWANLIAQARALALGKVGGDLARSFPGNRPSSTLILEDLSPESIGGLLSFYEAKTVYEAFIWGINPFDQYGVELGKTTATGIRGEMSKKNQDPNYRFDHLDDITRFYLDTLFSDEG